MLNCSNEGMSLFFWGGDAGQEAWTLFFAMTLDVVSMQPHFFDGLATNVCSVASISSLHVIVA